MQAQQYKPGQGDADIRVNGRIITEDAINREVQYHPAGSLREARRRAATALVVRELLLDEAERQGIDPEARQGAETEEEARIRVLIEQEVSCPEPSEEDCRRWYEANLEKMREPDTHEVSHILLPAPPDDAERRAEARNEAKDLIQRLQEHGASFVSLAREHSHCPSGEDGGHLGIIGPGQTAPEFERALSRQPIGEVAAQPIETRYGFHVVQVHERWPGEALDFEHARPRVESYLSESVRRRAVSQYIRILAGKADIHGIQLDEAATSPLVQ